MANDGCREIVDLAEKVQVCVCVGRLHLRFHYFVDDRPCLHSSYCSEVVLARHPIRAFSPSLVCLVDVWPCHGVCLCSVCGPIMTHLAPFLGQCHWATGGWTNALGWPAENVFSLCCHPILITASAIGRSYALAAPLEGRPLVACLLLPPVLEWQGWLEEVCIALSWHWLRWLELGYGLWGEVLRVKW